MILFLLYLVFITNAYDNTTKYKSMYNAELMNFPWPPNTRNMTEFMQFPENSIMVVTAVT